MGTPVSCTAAHGCEESRNPSALRPCGLLLFSDGLFPWLVDSGAQGGGGTQAGCPPQAGAPRNAGFLPSFFSHVPDPGP